MKGRDENSFVSMGDCESLFKVWSAILVLHALLVTHLSVMCSGGSSTHTAGQLSDEEPRPHKQWVQV